MSGEEDLERILKDLEKVKAPIVDELASADHGRTLWYYGDRGMTLSYSPRIKWKKIGEHAQIWQEEFGSKGYGEENKCNTKHPWNPQIKHGEVYVSIRQLEDGRGSLISHGRAYLDTGERVARHAFEFVSDYGKLLKVLDWFAENPQQNHRKFVHTIFKNDKGVPFDKADLFSDMTTLHVLHPSGEIKTYQVGQDKK